jgi:hypothetical protein
MGESRAVYSVLVGNLRERDHLEDRGVDGRVILEGSSGSGMWGVWTGSSCLGLEKVVGRV